MKLSAILFELEVFGIRYLVRTALMPENRHHMIWLLAYDETDLLGQWDLPYNEELGVVWPDYIVNAGDDELCIEVRNSIDKAFKLKAFW